jgi:hypothetical protein
MELICPSCGSEYREGFTHCASCDVDLVEPVPAEGEPEVDLVKVYETGNAAIIPLLESLFDDAGIEYMAKSEAIQDLFGWGRLGVNFNFVLGRPVEFFVREDAAEEARAIVKTLEDLPPADDASADESV